MSSTMFINARHNNYHIVDRIGPTKWSRNYTEFNGFSFAFNFEDSFRFVADDVHQWFIYNWHYSVYISVIYLLVIVILKKWMSLRYRPYHLRKPLALWSASLALFSIYGTVRALPEFFAILTEKGFVSSFCESTYYEDIRLVFCAYLFTISKVPELGDTLFIVLRKQKLIVLHWIHHVLTLCYCWFAVGDMPSTARWMANMNFAMHSLMYTYYTAKALQFRIPASVNMFITGTQITQMIVGLIINAIVFWFKMTGVPCDVSPAVVTTGLALYTLFAVLFVNFFIKSYFCGANKRCMNRINNNFDKQHKF